MDINYDPEAFSDEWEERQVILRQLAEEYQRFLDAALLGLLLDVCIARLEIEMAERGEGEPVLEADDLQEWRNPEENDVPLDGDAESALASAGFGTDEDYGGYTHDWEGDMY